MQFELAASTTFINVQTDFSELLSRLALCASFLSCQMGGPQSAAQFAWFGEDILRTTASVSVFAYLQLVNDSGRAAYEAQFGTILDITTNGTLISAPPRPFYLPAVFAIPHTGTSGGTVDVYLLPGRKQLFDSVLATGTPRVSPSMPILVNVTSNQYVKGVIIALPVFGYNDTGTRGPITGITTLLLRVANIVSTETPGSILTYSLADVTSSPAVVFNTSYPDCATTNDCSDIVWSTVRPPLSPLGPGYV